jgi:hypothetical protein
VLEGTTSGFVNKDLLVGGTAGELSVYGRADGVDLLGGTLASLGLPWFTFEERLLDVDAAPRFLFGAFFRRIRVHQRMNIIMATKTIPPPTETPAMSPVATLFFGMDEDLAGVGALVNAIGGPPSHSQCPCWPWNALPLRQ